MAMRERLLGGALVCLAMAGSATAGPLPYPTLVGSYNNPGVFGQIAFVGAVAQDGIPNAGNLGAAYTGVRTVNSITIDQYDDATRHRMHDLRIYTSPTTFVTASMADTQAPQTLTIPGGVTSDYFYITVESQYTGGSTDDNPGLTSLSFDGTAGAERTNFNSGITPTVVNALDPATYPPAAATNGQIQAAGQAVNEAVFFAYNGGSTRSMTVSYGSAQNVGSFGLGFETFDGNNGNRRPVPTFVTVSDSLGNSQQVTLAPHTLQYGQYVLPTPFLATTSLTITLPLDPAAYYAVGQDPHVGITEFQAFAAVPEPATAGLLAVAGMGVGLRRRRQM